MASASFMPVEVAFTRTVAIAAEIVDGVSLRRIRSGIEVGATGLKRAPVVNASGLWIWISEAGATAQAIVVISPDGIYAGASTTPVAPPACRRIELAPTPRYRFGPGTTAMRGTLVERTGSSILGTGSTTPVGGALIRLQWTDDNGWHDAPLASPTDADGAFAAVLRLPAEAEAVSDADGALSVRLTITRGSLVRTSAALPLRPGAVRSLSQPLIWDELPPVP